MILLMVRVVRCQFECIGINVNHVLVPINWSNLSLWRCWQPLQTSYMSLTSNTASCRALVVLRNSISAYHHHQFSSPGWMHASKASPVIVHSMVWSAVAEVARMTRRKRPDNMLTCWCPQTDWTWAVGLFIQGSWQGQLPEPATSAVQCASICVSDWPDWPSPQ